MFYQKHIEVGAHFLGGKGVGRYGDTVLTDTTVNPAGAEKPLPAMQLLLTLEWHSTALGCLRLRWRRVCG